ncbi:MAG: 3-isopropylmalate dehydratase small subunit [Eubacteriales bacterium]|nr:3-isopropylmalate dehydratase small subunit [Eubacteriales bacterium]
MGNVIKYGDNIDTDVIIPARYLNTSDPEVLKNYCMIDIDENFAKTVKTGDVMICGKNFGCGSSREHAPIAIKASGISLVVAKSFARIFYRNAINIGLAIVECSELVDDAQPNDTVSFDLSQGIIKIENKGLEYKIPKYPKEIQNIINQGGLLSAIKGGWL